MHKPAPLRQPPRTRLWLEALEDRLAPAFDVAISLAATSHMDTQTSGTTTTFTPTDTNATLDIADVAAQLRAGNDVVVSTGNTGDEDGKITWASSAALDFDGVPGARLLSLHAAGDVTVDAQVQDSDPQGSADTLSLSIQSATGHVALNAALRDLAGLQLGGDVAFAATVGTISLAGASASVTLGGGTYTLAGDLTVALPALANKLKITSGTFDAGTHALTVTGGTIEVSSATLTGSGTITAGAVVVAAYGGINPGGVGTAGTLAIVAPVSFQFGSALRADFGAASDLLAVTGSVWLDFEVRIESTGTPGPGPFTLMTYSSLASSPRGFYGTDFGKPFILGNDAFVASCSDTSVDVHLAPAGPSTFVGTLWFGGGFTVKLLGGGAELVVGPGDDGSSQNIDIVVRNSTLANTLLISRTGNTFVRHLRVNGSIGAITAPNVDTGDVVVTGFLRSITMHDSAGSLTAGGLPTQRTSITSAWVLAKVTLGSTIGSLTASYVVDTITAPAIGTLTTVPNPAAGLEGDVSCTLVLGPSPTGVALGTMKVAGGVAGGLWDIRGKVGSITIAKDMRGGFYLGATDSAGLPTQLGDITSLKVGGTLAETDISSTGKIGTLSAGTFSARIRAAAIGTLTTTGAQGDGSFWSDMVLDAGADGLAIGKATIKGPITGGLWDIRGKLGAISAAGDVSGLILSTPWWGGEHPGQLGDVASFSVGGSLSGTQVHSAGNLGSFTVAGSVGSDVSVEVSGRVNSFTAGDVAAATIKARTMGTLATKVHPAPAATTGDFTANLSLDSADMAATALTSARIAGGITGGVWDVRGKVGTVSVKMSISDVTFGTGFLGDVRAITVGEQVSSTPIHSAGRLFSVTAGRWFLSDIEAVSLGKLTIGTPAHPGDFLASAVTLTGSFGPAHNAIDKVTITGSAQGAVFDALLGNVASFVCASFDASRLYVGYQPAGDIETLGAFTGSFTLAEFRTTSFLGGSEVVANRFGTVRLSGVNTDADNAFGLRCNGAANRGSVRVAASGPDPIPLGNLNPTVAAPIVAGDFRFLVG